MKRTPRQTGASSCVNLVPRTKINGHCRWEQISEPMGQAPCGFKTEKEQTPANAEGTTAAPTGQADGVQFPSLLTPIRKTRPYGCGAGPHIVSSPFVAGVNFMEKSDKNISKRLSKVLRHAPEAMGLTLGDGGWANVADVLAGFERQGRQVSRDDLQRVVDTNDKKRFTLSDDRNRIRAAQGHSVTVDLGLVPVTPPTVLYHGTAVANLENIRAEGLMPQSRQHVHLSQDRETATRVGMRHGKPHILNLDCFKMHAEGYEFFQSDNGVWLTAFVPPEFIRGFANSHPQKD